MQKSIYSLVLSDRVVAEIDRLAYESGTSRSNIVNQILAEYVSYTTPEKRTRNIFASLEALLGSNAAMQVMMAPTDSMFALRSAISYKYNPSVKYSIELNKAPLSPNGGEIGEFRASVRSQSSSLTLCLLQFYKLWAGLETAYTGLSEYSTDGTRYIRKLYVRKNPSRGAAEEVQLGEAAVGEAIAAYVNAFDEALKAYFALLQSPASAYAAIERIYSQYIGKNQIIV